MGSYGRILVALDFSDCSQELVDQAVALAAQSCEIRLLHVAELPQGLPPTAHVGPGSGSSETAEGLLVRRSLERLEVYAEGLRARGHGVQTEVLVGVTAEMIVGSADAHLADLIIMGTHGRRGLSRMVGGSVAAEVISLASCPVLTVRTQHKPACKARSCDRCEGHLTTELQQLMAERDG